MFVFINHRADQQQNNSPGNKSIYTKNSQKNWIEKQRRGKKVVTKEILHDFTHVFVNKVEQILHNRS